MNSLRARAWLGFIFLAVAMCLLLFVTAGTVGYWQAWVYLATYFAGSFVTTLYLMKRNPALLARRLRGGPTAEKKRAQKIIMLLASIASFCWWYRHWITASSGHAYRSAS